MSESFPTAFGRYQLVERLGTGGMAEVFLAEIAGPREFSKRVVIKRLLPELTDDAEVVARFLEEARLSALLAHPNVVQVFELGDVEGDYYMAMEHIQGADLRKIERILWGSGAQVPIGMAATIVAAVCRGLDHAHGLCTDGVPLCVVHRDVSPSNVLISLEGGVKLIDFGVARAHARARLTKHGTTIMGKLVYASPEQVLGLSVTPRSDIFSVGCVLYEALTGVRPFERDTEPGTLTAITREAPQPPSKHRPAVPAALDGLVLRALARNPVERFATAAQMAKALESFVAERGQQIGTAQISGFVQVALEEQDAQTVTRLGEHEGRALEELARAGGPPGGSSPLAAALATPPRAARADAPPIAWPAPEPIARIGVGQAPPGLESAPTMIAMIGGVPASGARPDGTLQGPFGVVVRQHKAFSPRTEVPPDTATNDLPADPTVVDRAAASETDVEIVAPLPDLPRSPTRFGVPLSSVDSSGPTTGVETAVMMAPGMPLSSVDSSGPTTGVETAVMMVPSALAATAPAVAAPALAAPKPAPADRRPADEAGSRKAVTDDRRPLGASGLDTVRAKPIPVLYLAMAAAAAVVAAVLVVLLWPHGDEPSPRPVARASARTTKLPPLPPRGAALPPPAAQQRPPTTAPAPAPSVEPAKAAPRSSRLGRLRLFSRPSGAIEIDGQRIGQSTPLVGYGLEPGVHRIRVTNDRVRKSASIRVKIVAGRVVSRTLRLRRSQR